MAHPFSKPISKASVRELLSAEASDIAKFTKKESISYEKRLRAVAERRINTIQKHGKYSPAQQAYLPKGLPSLTSESESRQLSQHNIALIKEFLEAKTSTLTGIRKQSKEVAARIFGADSKGNPRGSFTNRDEEERFWRAYEEFKHQNPVFALQSTRLQQFLGQETFWRTRDYTAQDFDTLLNRLMRNDATVDVRAAAALADYDFEV